MAGEPEGRDRVEAWATRIGRTLGYIFVIALAVYLIAEYWPSG